MILEADNEGPDQYVRMHRLIRACVVRKLHRPFSCVVHQIWSEFGASCMVKWPPFSQADPNLCWSRKLIIKEIILKSNEHTHKIENSKSIKLSGPNIFGQSGLIEYQFIIYWLCVFTFILMQLDCLPSYWFSISIKSIHILQKSYLLKCLFLWFGWSVLSFWQVKEIICVRKWSWRSTLRLLD